MPKCAWACKLARVHLKPAPPVIKAGRGLAGELGDVDVGLATSLEVFQSLAAEGFQLSYRRIPLSRERTPEAADLDVLHSQLQEQPEGE